MSSYSIADARSHLPRLVRQAESGAEVELTRRGRPVAILLGLKEYAKLRAGKVDFWEAYRQHLDRWRDSGVELDPDEIFADARVDSPGREFSW